MYFIIFCFKFSSIVTQLTDKNFGQIIDKRKNNSVFIVMFHGDYCPTCRQCYPIFQDAATESDGMINFAQLDSSNNPRVANRFQVMTIPTWYVFHSKGKNKFSQYPSVRSMIGFASKYLIDQTMSVNESWLPGEGKKNAILFSSKPKSPPLWSSISNNFSMTDIQIGFTNNATLRSKFQVDKLPAIVLINGNETITYQGKTKFSLLQEFVSSNFGFSNKTVKKTPITEKGRIIKISDNSEFKKKCKRREFCVFQINRKEEITSEFKGISEKFKNDNFIFAICGNQCPISGMPEGFLVFHPKKDVGIKIEKENYDLLSRSLDRVIDGTSSWINLDNLLVTKEI